MAVIRLTQAAAVSGDGALVNHSAPTSPSAAAAAISGMWLSPKRFQRNPVRPDQGDRLHEPAHRAGPPSSAATSAHTEQTTASSAHAAPT